MYKILIWLSGGDYHLLDKCTELERKKYAMYGFLILIPTFMAFVSMSYALSTFITDERLILFAGLFLGGKHFGN